ncbi:MAG TPA: hypothetical protein PKY59_24525 [Pyrinomonadaceae bacterium]|nr:hypothetical protein [Pyrinomonadaceae bacterium]
MNKYIFALILVFAFSVFTFAQDRVQLDDDQTYLILSTKKIGTMEKELDEASTKGFRVVYGAPTQQYDMALFLEKIGKNDKSYSYKILATSRNKTMEKELNELAAQGYRLLPRTIIFKQGFLTAELVMVMEKNPNSNKQYEYKLVEAFKETKLHKKIEEAIAGGFNPVTMITMGNHVIVTEKETVRP